MAEISVCEGTTIDKDVERSAAMLEADQEPLATSGCTREASTIQAIDKASVHRICSGQVVLTLATAVKELLENSIDAGATHVEIKLKDYGAESIEVADNGCGVYESDFEGLTLKHYTSKLQNFDDLVNITSFGFRGEALSSLCALSNMVITTRHKSATVGTRLELDQNGKIISKKSTPRQVGTTVQVHNIFHSLPVRHKEFHRNLKKEFARLVQVLNAYCLINTKIRISCSNQTSKGSRSTIVSTDGNESMKENIANVFGPKQLQTLLEFKQVEPDDDTCCELGIKPDKKPGINLRIEGFISKCEHGQGRSSTDRQFIFINGRPCDHTKILKLINEVYHSYNKHQSPFVAISIVMDKDTVDVNVTPDKRQIFLEGENLLLATLKASLIQMFESTVSVYKVNNSVLLSQSDAKECRTVSQKQFVAMDSGSPSLSSSLLRLKRSFSSAFARDESASDPECDGINVKLKPSSVTSMSGRKSNSFPSHSTPSNHGSITQFFSKFSPTKSAATHTLPPSPFLDETNNGMAGNVKSDASNIATSQRTQPTCDSPANEIYDIHSHQQQTSKDDSNSDNTIDLSSDLDQTSDVNTIQLQHQNISENLQQNQNINVNNKNSNLRPEDSEYTKVNVHKESFQNKDVDRLLTLESLNQENDKRSFNIADSEDQNFITDQNLYLDGETVGRKREQTFSFCLSTLQKKIQSTACNPGSSHFYRNFRAKICPTDNRSAEEELQKEISKDMFERMEIVGQFNLGFIITKLGSDLFIVDQHATDEKYNFEMLQRNTVLQSQKMIIPQNLELTASNETILIDNLEIFKKNGFDFIIDSEASPTQRVKLIAAPVSKNWTFGKDDIEELLFMLADSPNVMCWPSRVRMMFASRACRKSVMIGTALNKHEMKRLICHMGQIEQPWNCPHGRPTMRHLFNMDMLPSTNTL